MPQSHLPIEQLRQVLASDGQAETAEWPLDNRMEQHLQSCAECQNELERISADNSWWSKASDYLNSDEVDRELEPLGESAWSGIVSHDSLQALTDAAILEPAGHPEMLGRIGHYDIEQVIGRGGMGVVYKGYDHELNRAVAIKVLSPHLASNATARKRFEREARAAAAVVHPHVIPIHGVNSQGKLPYIVMPLVAGRSLQEQVDQQGPLETKDIIRIGMQIAAGLDAAHKQGLVHRDIKPANILIEEDVSRVMITDFGLARAADDAAMTQTGWLAGTPNYMSPEQASGSAITFSSDLFSLGCVMYFMATGRVPFRAESPVAVLNLICHGRVTPVRQVNADIPKPLADIIERLLEKQPAHRFRSAGQVQQLLEQYLAYLQRPDSAAPPKIARLPRRTISELNSYWSVGIAMLAIVLTVCAAHMLGGWGSGNGGTESQRGAASHGGAALNEGAEVNPPAAATEEFPGPMPVPGLVSPSGQPLLLMHPEDFDRELRELEREIEAMTRELRLPETPPALRTRN